MKLQLSSFRGLSTPFSSRVSFLKTSKSADNEMLTWFCVNKEQILKQVLVFISLRTDKGSADGLIMLHSGQDGDECEAKMKGYEGIMD